MWTACQPAASRLAEPDPEPHISQIRRHAGSGDPAFQFTPDNVGNHSHSGFAVVQAGNRGKILSAVMMKYLGVFACDLFQRL